MRLLQNFVWAGTFAAFAVGCTSSEADDTNAEPNDATPSDDTALDTGASSAGAGGMQMQAVGTNESGGTAGAIATGGASGSGGTAVTVKADAGSAGAIGTMDAGNPIISVEASAPRPCTHLPASGTWENISPVKTPAGNTTGRNYAEAIAVDPFDAATVWHGTGYGGLFKSSDCGATFVRVNTGRSADALQGSALGSIAIDPVNKGVMFTTAFEGANGLFKSTNGGVDWDQLLPPGSAVFKAVESNLVNSVAMDAHDPRHLVISMHANCLAPFGPVCEAETIDAGATWTVTTVPIPGGGWVPGAGAFILSATSWLFGSYSSGLWLTTDRGATWSNVTPQGASGSTAGKTICIPFYPNPADGKYYLPTMEGVIRSTTADGHAWSFLAGSAGRTVGFAMGGGHVYAADQWSTTYRVAAESDPSTWSKIPPPAELPSDQGAPYLAYDAAHHVLYSSNFAAGLWRLVNP